MTKACSRCGKRRSLCSCPKKIRPYNSLQYKMNRQIVLMEEYTCWLCGEPARSDDPLTADHVIEVAAGGTSDRTNLRAAHLSCNGRRGVVFREGG